MTNPYGPRATAIDAGRNPQLSAFWRQRLAMLVPASRTSAAFFRGNLLGLLAAAALVCALPTFHAAPAVAEQEKVSQEQGKDRKTDSVARQPVAAESEQSSADAAKEARQKGKSCYRKGDFDGAISAYTEAIRLDPKSVEAHDGRGAAYSHKGDNDKAIADYTEAIRLDPKDTAAYCGRGGVYCHVAAYRIGTEHDFDKAIADFTEAIRLDPKLAGAYCGRGNVYNAKGDDDEAIVDFTEAIRLDPKQAWAYYGRGSAHDRKGEPDKAIADFTEEIRVAPNSYWAYQGRGSVYKEKGDKANAEKDLEQAKKLIHLHFMTAAEAVAETGSSSAVVPAGPAGEPNARREKQITNSIGMKLTLVPSGEFLMGSGESAEETHTLLTKTEGKNSLPADFFKMEHPQHRVRITKPFYLGTYHVTRGQFQQFVADTGYKTDAEKGEQPGAYGWDPDKKEFGFNEKYSWRKWGFEQTDEHPVVNVSWNDAVAFCKWLSGKEGKTYRLPTEAEWEYACRAGTTTRYYSGDDPEALAKVGNVADATAKARFPDWKNTIKASDGYAFTAPVGSFKPNAFGLYDMHGNAFQWCADWYGAEYYTASPADDPSGPDSGMVRILRGGSWIDGPVYCRSAFRNSLAHDYQWYFTGFRVARTQTLEEKDANQKTGSVAKPNNQANVPGSP